MLKKTLIFSCFLVLGCTGNPANKIEYSHPTHGVQNIKGEQYKIASQECEKVIYQTPRTLNIPERHGLFGKREATTWTVKNTKDLGYIYLKGLAPEKEVQNLISEIQADKQKCLKSKGWKKVDSKLTTSS